MSNTFDAVPLGAHERSTAFLAVDEPQLRLDEIIEEAQLHRGSLREQDGYTIPFREGGSVRITVVQGAGGGGSGLRFTTDAPTVERRTHIEETIGQQVAGQLTGDAGVLTFEPVG
ncbi:MULTISPECIES: hypothetical protein [unclassified Ornithinimicrobium]|uniref:hypothetical protein n=1 Tax=unclassified Ornithinimicrobium TaxID=2615080 RepID=UPI0038523F15